MRQMSSWILCLTVAFALVVPIHRASAQSGISINLHIGDRYRGPDLGFTSEPSLVAVQGDDGVYYAQDSDYDVYRYSNMWYMNYNGDWYRASNYSGPWLFVGYQSVPRNVYSVPTQYRRRWSNYRDTHYSWGRSNESRTAPARTRTRGMTTRWSPSGSRDVTVSPTRTRGTMATPRWSRSQTYTPSPTRTRVAPVAATRRTSRRGNVGGQGQNQRQDQNQGQDQTHGQGQNQRQRHNQGQDQNQGH